MFTTMNQGAKLLVSRPGVQVYKCTVKHHQVKLTCHIELGISSILDIIIKYFSSRHQKTLKKL